MFCPGCRKKTTRNTVFENNFEFFLRYKSLLDQIFKIVDANERIEETKSFVDLLINESVGLVISRQLFSDLCNLLTDFSIEEAKFVANYALEKIQPRAISFEDQVTSYRQFLSEIYEKEGEWKKAANMLNGIPLETSQK
jgi:COP9 signalosome complex subunit 4